MQYSNKITMKIRNWLTRTISILVLGDSILGYTNTNIDKLELLIRAIRD